jgi:hypothetical protein
MRMPIFVIVTMAGGLDLLSSMTGALAVGSSMVMHFNMTS